MTYADLKPSFDTLLFHYADDGVDDIAKWDTEDLAYLATLISDELARRSSLYWGW